MNNWSVDFSNTSIRKFSHTLSNVNFSKNVVCKPRLIPATSNKDLPHELRKSITVLSLIEKSGKYSDAELKPLKEKIKLLKEKYSKI